MPGFDPGSALPVSTFDPSSAAPAPAAPAFDPGSAQEAPLPEDNLDEAINSAAGVWRVDPGLLRRIGEVETGLGKSSIYDPATGRSKTPGNNGVGIFQLDPASGADKKTLELARTNPRFAASIAAQMLAKNIQKYGNVRDAVAAYNAGDPHSAKGQAYANQVLGPAQTAKPQEANLLDVHSLQAVARQSASAVQGWKAKFDQNADWAAHHPGQAMMALLGAPQRAVGATLIDVLEGRPGDIPKDLWHDVRDPSDHAAVINRLETDILHKVGFKGADPETMHGIGKFLLDLGVETVTDPTTYIPIGGLFMMAGKAGRLLGASSHSAQAIAEALKGSGEFAKSPVVRAMISKLENYDHAIRRATKTASKLTNDLFGTRPDLERHFTDLGKNARISLENVANLGKVERRQADAKLLDKWGGELKKLKYGDVLPPEVQNHMLAEAWRYGTQASRDEAIHLGFKPSSADLKMFPQPKEFIDYGGPLADNFIPKVIPKSAKWFDKMDVDGQDAIKFFKSPGKGGIKLPFGKAVDDLNKFDAAMQDFTMYDLVKNRLMLSNEVIRRLQVAHSTADLAIKYGDKVLKTDMFFPEKKNFVDWLANNVVDKVTGAHLRVGDVAVLDKLSDLYKTGILGNPIPHGIVNVGTALWFHTNPAVAMRGLAYALMPAPVRDRVVGKLVSRLGQYGGRTSYWRETTSFGRNIAKVLNPVQQMLDHFETGMRASLLQHLDKTMAGDISKAGLQQGDELAELVKTAAVDQKLGGYSHPNKLIQMFKGLGGLYDAFRLGTVPRAGAAALARGTYGRDIALAERTQEDFSDNFLPSNKHLDIFGPLNDFTRMIFDPLDFMTSSSTVGPVIAALFNAKKAEAQTGHKQSFMDTLEQMANVIPGVGSAERFLDPKNQDIPAWVRFWLEAVGGAYPTQERSPRTMRTLRRAYGREAQLPDVPWLFGPQGE